MIYNEFVGKKIKIVYDNGVIKLFRTFFDVNKRFKLTKKVKVTFQEE